MLKLEFPEEKHKKMYERAIKEWNKLEISLESPGRFFVGDNFVSFLEVIKNDVNNNHNGVNSHLFFLIKKDEIIGAIQIRHTIDHPNLIENGGHIGYGIVPGHRKKGHATKMLELGLIEAKKIGLKEVLITCNIDNLGSCKVIEKNAGVFERFSRDLSKKRYWIKL